MNEHGWWFEWRLGSIGELEVEVVVKDVRVVCVVDRWDAQI